MSDGEIAFLGLFVGLGRLEKISQLAGQLTEYLLHVLASRLYDCGGLTIDVVSACGTHMEAEAACSGMGG